MSILIKGMEMPSEQYGKMVITLYPNGNVAEYVGDMGRVWEAVPVVRCRDCKWCGSPSHCPDRDWLLDDEGFCSWGERKDNADE